MGGIAVTLREPATEAVEQSQLALGLSVPLFGSLSVPVRSPFEVFHHNLVQES
jgi:hypothetical protein